MLQRIYSLSPRARLVEAAGRKLLVTDFPLQQFELNDTAWRVLSALPQHSMPSAPLPLDELVNPVTPDLVDFLEGKVHQGTLRAEYRATAPTEWPRVEVVIPVLANPAGLWRCLEGLARLEYPADLLRVTVVDDASPTPVQTALPGAVPPSLAVRWLRLGRNQGPASARNAALEQPWPVPTEGPGEPVGEWATLYAFIDSDCVPGPNWLRPLVSVLEDESLAAVGGQVQGLRRDGWLARYEAECSSLNLGGAAGPAGDPAHRHPYLPSCNLIVRGGALRQVGGFRAGLRLAEDVDLCWRLRAAGARLFYFPPGAVAHDHRRRLWSFMERKRAYARSEAWLRRIHPGHFPTAGLRGLRAVAVAATLASVLGVGWGLVVLALCLLVESAVHAWTLPRFSVPVTPTVFGAALGRRAAAGLAHVCRGATRATLVLWVPALALVPKLWPACIVMLTLGAWAEWQHRRPALRRREFAVGFLFDALGYSVGKAEGTIRSALARKGASLPAA